MERQSHWTEARELASNYSHQHSVLYASDHLAALIDKRLTVKPNNLTDSEWSEYKDTTHKIQEALETVNQLLKYQSLV